jgi:predicted small metal-binding protein
MKIKRYVITEVDARDQSYSSYFECNETGMWCKWEDVRELLEEIEADELDHMEMVEVMDMESDD